MKNRTVFSLSLPGLLSVTLGAVAMAQSAFPALPAMPAPVAVPVAPVAPALPAPMAFESLPVALPELPPIALAYADLANEYPFADAYPGPLQAPGPNPQPGPPAHDPDYNVGLKAMDEARWNDAVNAFERSAKASPDQAQAALYWKAYSLEKLGRKDDATATCNVVISDPSKSQWKVECQRLSAETNYSQRDLERMIERADRDANRAVEINTRLAEVRVEGRDKRDPVDPDDELRVIALNAIMQQDPAKAMPLLHSFIFSTKSIDVRKRALFILVRSKDPAAQAMLLEAAKDNNDIELERAAVQSLGMRGKTEAPRLKEIYLNATDKRVKEAAVGGLFVAGDAADMVELARAEKDIDLKRNLVSQLSVMKDPAATAYMIELLK